MLPQRGLPGPLHTSRKKLTFVPRVVFQCFFPIEFLKTMEAKESFSSRFSSGSERAPPSLAESLSPPALRKGNGC